MRPVVGNRPAPGRFGRERGGTHRARDCYPARQRKKDPYPGRKRASMSERGSETAGESPAAQQAASERRTIEAAGRNRKLAAAALMRLGGDCPPPLEEVGTEGVLHSHYPWSEIGRRPGPTRPPVSSPVPHSVASH